MQSFAQVGSVARVRAELSFYLLLEFENLSSVWVEDVQCLFCRLGTFNRNFHLIDFGIITHLVLWAAGGYRIQLTVYKIGL